MYPKMYMYVNLLLGTQSNVINVNVLLQWEFKFGIYTNDFFSRHINWLLYSVLRRIGNISAIYRRTADIWHVDWVSMVCTHTHR